MTDGPSLAALAAGVHDPRVWAVAAIAFGGGIIRGFSGFGGALIFIPLVASVLGPRMAVPLFYMSDMFTASPWGLRSARKCNWREMAPILAGAMLLLPFGASILASVDPTMLRWITSMLVLAMLVLLATGWRYPNAPTAPVSFGVGGTAGLMGGATGITGPLIIAYWLGSSASTALVRVNIIVFYAITSLYSDVIFFWRGLFTWQVAGFALVAAPLYGIGLVGGARLFNRTSEKTYRRAALGLIAVSSLISLPIFDGWLR